jgi:methionyl-tRNA synthetase
METKKNKFYVTTPIYYVTAKPHLGHLYSTVIADVLARWHKLKNERVFFLTGTDEFGQKIAQEAQKVGKQPQEFVDSFIDAYKTVWREYTIDYSIFMRTTTPFHIKAVQKWILQLMAKGDIYKSFYEGWYCTHCETFVTDGELQEIGPQCPTCGRQTQRLAEEAYFFKLSAYQDALLDFYEKNPEFIVPKERAHEVINFVKSGLKDLSISRTTVKWGVPFPGDTHHVTYVWADALNNYITAVGWGQPDKAAEFKLWWPADVQVMGKDIIRFHAIYWPAFLMATGLALPKHLLVHGWFKVGAQKMSKSLGNVVDPAVLYKEYGADPVRYYLMKQMAITHDGEFTIEDLEQKITADLADDLGNLLNRMTTLAQKYNVQTLTPPAKMSAEIQKLYDEGRAALEQMNTHMDEFMFHMALARLWKFIKEVNAYFHAQEPWKVAPHDLATFKEILWATAQGLRMIGIVLWPFMPDTMDKLLASLGMARDMDINSIDLLMRDPWKQTFMITKIDTLFQKPMPKEPTVSAPTAEQKPDDSISIEEFSKVKLMIGTIQECQEVPQSDKLYKLQVNFGPLGMRQILSGIKKHFMPEQLKGRQGTFVVNLKPRKMMGLESHGMMLLAEDETGTLQMICPAGPVANGTLLR